MQHPAHPSIEAIAEEPFAVAATASTTRPRHTLEGAQPLLLGSNVDDDNAMLTVDLTNPDMRRICG